MIIALTGKKRSGKNSVVGYISTELCRHWQNYKRHEVYDYAFADALRATCACAFPLMNFTNDRVKEEPCPAYGGLTPRRVLQHVGSACRELDPDVWVKALDNVLDWRTASSRLVVITDCRYLNEAAAVKARGGVIWRVVRPGLPESGDLHSSETEQDAIVADDTILNDGSLDDLQDRVKTAFTKLQEKPCGS